MPSDTEVLKCVMHQVELMENKSNMSQVELKIEVREPHPSLGCQAGYGTPLLTRSDSSADDKKMVTVLDSEVDLNGRCYEATWTVLKLSSASKTSFHTFCTASDGLEY